jgi:hypothetical protein
MSTLQRIVLHLARTHDFPAGSASHGYELVAPLDDNGSIDLQAWKKLRQTCTVVRFWGREPEKTGNLVHRPGGFDGATWGFDYDSTRRDDDEAGYRFGEHRFRIGEYVSIREADGETLPFKITDIQPFE